MLKPLECQSCPLYKISNSFSKVEGNYTIPLLFVGEALGHEEAIDGLPFRPYAQAGSKLKQAIELAGYSREDFAYWNIIGCQPPNNKLTGQWFENGAKNYCYRTHFIYVLDKLKPKVIVTLGNIAFRYLTNQEEISVLDVRGFPFKYGRTRLSSEREWNPIVIPAIHPSFIKKGKEYLTPLLVEDIKKAVRMAKGGVNANDIMIKFIERKVRIPENYKSTEYTYELKEKDDGEGMDDDVPF